VIAKFAPDIQTKLPHIGEIGLANPLLNSAVKFMERIMVAIHCGLLGSSPYILFFPDFINYA